MLINANESEKIKENEQVHQEKENFLLNEIENEKKNIFEIKEIVDLKDNNIKKLNFEIYELKKTQEVNSKTIANQYIQIQQYSINLDDLHNNILSKKNEIFKLQQEIVNHQNTIKNSECSLVKKDADMMDIKNKGKILINQYNKKIENLINKTQDLDSNIAKSKKEYNELNSFLNEIKNEKNNLEEKYYK